MVDHRIVSGYLQRHNIYKIITSLWWWHITRTVTNWLPAAHSKVNIQNHITAPSGEEVKQDKSSCTGMVVMCDDLLVIVVIVACNNHVSISYHIRDKAILVKNKFSCALHLTLNYAFLTSSSWNKEHPWLNIRSDREAIQLPCGPVKYTLSLRFNGHFPGEPGLAGVYWIKGWWRWWWQLDYWSYKSCKAPVNNSHHQQTNIQFFYRPDALPVAQPTASKHWRENITFHGLTYTKLTWGSSNFVSDH